MATNEHFLLASLAKVDNINDGVVYTVKEAVQKVKKERSRAKLANGPCMEPLVRKALRKMDQNALIEFVNVDDQPSFRITPRGIHGIKRALLAYPPRTRRVARSPCSLRAREVFRLGSFLKKRLVRDTDDLFEELRNDCRATRDIEIDMDVGIERVCEVGVSVPSIQVTSSEEMSAPLPSARLNPPLPSSSLPVTSTYTQEPIPTPAPAAVPSGSRSFTHLASKLSFLDILSETESNLDLNSESGSEFERGSSSGPEGEGRRSLSSTLYRTPSPEARYVSSSGSASRLCVRSPRRPYLGGRKGKEREHAHIESGFRDYCGIFDELDSDRTHSLGFDSIIASSGIEHSLFTPFVPAIANRRLRATKMHDASHPGRMTGSSIDPTSRTSLAPFLQRPLYACGERTCTCACGGAVYHPYKKLITGTARQTRSRARSMIFLGDRNA